MSYTARMLVVYHVDKWSLKKKFLFFLAYLVSACFISFFLACLCYQGKWDVEIFNSFCLRLEELLRYFGFRC